MILVDQSAGSRDEIKIELRRNAWTLQPKRLLRAAHGPRFWFRAVRGISLPLSICPILLGGELALSRGLVNWPLLAIALLGGVAAHLATNLISDYFDFVKGVDTTNALSSHTGVLVDELIDPDRILIAAMVGFLLTAFAGGVLTVVVGWPILLLGLAGIVGVSYTGGPKAWKYAGLGELSTGFLIPLMVCGSYFVRHAAVLYRRYCCPSRSDYWFPPSRWQIISVMPLMTNSRE